MSNEKVDAKKEVVKSERERKLRDKEKANTATDNIFLEEVLRGFRILYLNENHFLKKLFNIDSIRIYDKSMLSVSKYGDMEFTRERGRLMDDPTYKTQEEQLALLKKRGIWSEDHDKKMNDLRIEVDELIRERNVLFERIEKAEKANKKKEKEKAVMDSEALAVRMEKLHKELMEMTNTYTMFFRDTIELRSQMVQYMGWVVSAVCKDEGDEKYDPSKTLWKDIASLEMDLKDNDFTLLLNECADFWNSSQPESESFFAESPEELTPGFDGETPKN